MTPESAINLIKTAPDVAETMTYTGEGTNRVPATEETFGRIVNGGAGLNSQRYVKVEATMRKNGIS